MAKIKKEDIKELSTEELREKVNTEKVRYQKMKFNHAVSPLDNPLTLRALRRDVARLKTELRNRELQEAQAEQE